MSKQETNAMYRIEQLEKNYEQLDGKIDLLLSNHLPHLQEAISTLKMKINMFTAINIGAIILGIIATKLIK